MLRLVRLISLRRLREAPARTMRVIAAVMVGVGAMVSVHMIGRAISLGVEESLDAFTGHTALRIDGGETGIPESLLEPVRAVPGVATAAPLLQSSAYAVGTAGEVLTVLGVDLTEEHDVRRYGADPGAEEVIDDPLVFLSQPNSIILTRPYAERHGLHRDDRIELTTPSGKRTFVVRGLLASEGPAVAFGGNLAVMDYQAAQVAFAKQSRLDEIDIVAAPGADVAALGAALRAAVGPGVRVEPPGARRDEIALATRTVGFVFWLFSSLTVIVAMFLVFNSVSMVVAQRGRELALLRAIGMRRADGVRLLLVEAAFLGVVGGVAGIPFGVLMARLMLRPTTESVSTALFFRVGASDIEAIGPGILGFAILLGIVSTLLAAWIPARQAARFVPVVAARRGAVVALRQARLPPVWSAIACLAAGALIAGASRRWHAGRLGPGVDATWVVGFALLAPWLVRAAIPLLARWARVLGALGPLAVMNLSLNVQRSALTAAPLMVAVAFAVVVGTMLESFRASIDAWMAGFVQADFQIASVSQEPGRNVLLPEAVAAGMAAIPGVAGVHRFRLVHAPLGGRRVAIEYYDYDVDDPTRCCVRFRRGDPPSAYTRLAAGSAVVVSENLAESFHVRPGDMIQLPTPRGLRALPIAATATNYNGDQGSVMMARSLFVDLFGDDRMDYVLVRVEPGTDPDAVRRALVARWGEEYQLSVFTNADLRRDILARIDRAFLPASSLFVLAIVVGCFGIANSLQVSLTERVREIGMLRSLGSRRRDVVQLIVTEAGVIGLLGALLGLGLGAALSYVWVAIHVRHYLGWIIEYHFALAGAVVGFGAALLTAPLAGWRPARRAARMSPVEALAHE